MLESDGLTIISPMQPGVEHSVKVAIEAREERRPNLAVILDTAGGIVEVVERIVRVLRQHYTEVKFVIPDRAMSAGTAMSGDPMDYHSCLGPIDPQLERDGRLVPALSYLAQYGNLIEKSARTCQPRSWFCSRSSTWRNSISSNSRAVFRLICRWLTSYKFKDWVTTETRRIPAPKERRASQLDRAATERPRAMADARSGNRHAHPTGRAVAEDQRLRC